MIPNTLHFVFGMSEDFGGKPFSLIHYLSIKSAILTNRPDHAVLWYAFAPSGHWWDKAKALVDVRVVGHVTERYGPNLTQYAHRADIVRLEKLLEFGGIYMDLDVIALTPLHALRQFECVWAEEGSADLLNNGVILARPGAEFLVRCLAAWTKFEPWMWNEISCGYPAQLAKERPDLVHVEDRYAFHWPLWRPVDAIEMFEGDRNDWPAAYCRHLWESKTWGPYLKSLSVAQLRGATTNFARLIAPFVAGEQDE